MSDRRGGFTLVELTVVALLGVLLIMVIVQTLITNQKTYTAQSVRIQGQQAMRASAEVLFADLRELSAQGGDIITMSSSQLHVRSMRKFGVVCSLTTTAPPVLRVVQVGEWFEAQDSTFIFADNSPTISTDDTWISVQVTAVDTTVACGARAQDLSFTGQAPVFAAAAVLAGAAVRSYVHQTYGLMTYGGKSYLGRTDASGTTVPLVGPLEASTGLRFVYLDSLGATTANRFDVRQIQVTVRASAPVLNSVGEAYSDSITARVFTRN